MFCEIDSEIGCKNMKTRILEHEPVQVMISHVRISTCTVVHVLINQEPPFPFIIISGGIGGGQASTSTSSINTQAERRE